jgi:TonB family protein
MLPRSSVIEPDWKYRAYLLRLGSRLCAIVKRLGMLLAVDETAAATGAPSGLKWLLFGLFALIIGWLMGGVAGIRHRLPGNPAYYISQTPLSLQAERRGADLRVSWNLNAEMAGHAEAGVLRIRDGDSSPREVRLDAVHLRTGSLVYTPLTKQVQFRLEVSDVYQRRASEWLLVLAAERPQAPELAAGRNASSQALPLPPRHGPGFHEVQVGSFRIRANAERLCAQMEARYGHARVALATSDPPLWRVLVERENIAANSELITAVSSPRRAVLVAKALGVPTRTVEAPAALPSRQSSPGEKALAGDLVSDQVVQQVLPEVSRKARNSIQGTVRVRVKVRADASGSVVVATLDSPGPSRYFAELALQAARGWKFSPATFDGRVSSDWILRFEFARNATKVYPVLATPADKIGKS